MNGFLPHCFLLAFAAALLGSCETRSAADRRIEKNPALYQRLNEREKELVRSGEVKEGMTQEAVFLAWGRPDRVVSGSREGSASEKWAYFDTAPVSNVSVGFGTGGVHPFYSSFGVHPAFGYGYGPGWGYGTDIDYVSHISRQVEFTNGKVTSWERTR